MKLRELNKVKNELLIQLEDFLLDNIFDFEALADSTDEEKMAFSTNFTKKVIDKIKANPIEIAKIVFCDERGNDLSDDELSKYPLKIELVKRALPDIMEVLLGSLAEEENEGKSQAQKRARVKTATK